MKFQKVSKPVSNGPREFGQIKMISADGNFAFIRTPGGTDVYVSMGEALQAGIYLNKLHAGTKLSFDRVQTTDGRQRAVNLMLDISASETDLFREICDQPQRVRYLSSSGEEWREGSIKFFDPEKKFGFVSVPGNHKDAFLPVHTLRSGGFDTDQRLQDVPVLVIIGPGKRPDSLTVQAISPL